MKVGVPSMGDKGLEEEISQHFGRGPTFTIYDTETEEVEIIPNTSEHRGGKGKPPELLAEKGIDVMLCSNLGRRAIAMFEEFDIQVYSGAGGKVKDAIEAWGEGDLKEATKESGCRGRHR